ncbi:hypothetical protein PCE1_003542 [Barthelona sp. PCE]
MFRTWLSGKQHSYSHDETYTAIHKEQPTDGNYVFMLENEGSIVCGPHRVKRCYMSPETYYHIEKTNETEISIFLYKLERNVFTKQSSHCVSRDFTPSTTYCVLNSQNMMIFMDDEIQVVDFLVDITVAGFEGSKMDHFFWGGNLYLVKDCEIREKVMLTQTIPYFEQNHPLMGVSYCCLDMTPGEEAVVAIDNNRYVTYIVSDGTLSCNTIEFNLPHALPHRRIVRFGEHIVFVDNDGGLTFKRDSLIRESGIHKFSFSDFVLLSNTLYCYSNGMYMRCGITESKASPLFTFEENMVLKKSNHHCLPFFHDEKNSKYVFIDTDTPHITILRPDPSWRVSGDVYNIVPTDYRGSVKVGYLVRKGHIFEVYFGNELRHRLDPRDASVMLDPKLIVFNEGHCVCPLNKRNLFVIDSTELPTTQPVSGYSLCDDTVWVVCGNRFDVYSVDEIIGQPVTAILECEQVTAITANPYAPMEAIVQATIGGISKTFMIQCLTELKFTEIIHEYSEFLFTAPGAVLLDGVAFVFDGETYVRRGMLPNTQWETSEYVTSSHSNGCVTRTRLALDALCVEKQVISFDKLYTSCMHSVFTLPISSLLQKASCSVLTNFGVYAENLCLY